MPVSITSRYYGLEIFQAEDAEGEKHPTIALRSNPPLAPTAGMYRHTLIGLETLEYLAWRYYGLSEAWWRIAEVNPVAFPLDLTPGTPVSVPSASEVGRVPRTRKV